MSGQQQEDRSLAMNSPSELLRIAIESKADLQQLEKLMDLQERYNKQQAQKKYFLAKSKFQGECPELKKTKKVNFDLKTGGKVRYNYTPLGEIISKTKKPLQVNGLSYRWELEEKDNKIFCTCILTHCEGHSEKTTMSAHADSSGNKNEIQQKGSTITYLERYTLTSILGIGSADEDNDGNTSGEAKRPAPMEIPEEIKIDLNSMNTVKELDEYLVKYCGAFKNDDNFRTYAGGIRKKLALKSNSNPSKPTLL